MGVHKPIGAKTNDWLFDSDGSIASDLDADTAAALDDGRWHPWHNPDHAKANGGNQGVFQSPTSNWSSLIPSVHLTNVKHVICQYD